MLPHLSRHHRSIHQALRPISIVLPLPGAPCTSPNFSRNLSSTRPLIRARAPFLVALPYCCRHGHSPMLSTSRFRLGRVSCRRTPLRQPLPSPLVSPQANIILRRCRKPQPLPSLSPCQHLPRAAVSGRASPTLVA